MYFNKTFFCYQLYPVTYQFYFSPCLPYRCNKCYLTLLNFRKVLATLDQTRTDSRIMKENIRNIREKYEDSKKKTASLLTQLTLRATVLEKLKAKVGEATSLSAFLQLNELSSDEEDEDDLLKPGQIRLSRYLRMLQSDWLMKC